MPRDLGRERRGRRGGIPGGYEEAGRTKPQDAGGLVSRDGDTGRARNTVGQRLRASVGWTRDERGWGLL